MSKEKSSNEAKTHEKGIDVEESDEEEVAQKEACKQSTQMSDAMQLTAKLWSRHKMEWPECAVDTRSSLLLSKPERLTSEKKHKRTSYKDRKPFHIHSRAYSEWNENTAKTWLRTVRQRTDADGRNVAPNAKQDEFLVRVLDRCATEAEEFHKGADACSSEPLRDCLLGIPGAGKSECIKLLRDFFENCLGWEDGMQFQFLASQNSMAALIGGATLHTWGTVPINAKDAAAKVRSKADKGDVDQLYLNALSMRFLIIDEVFRSF